MLSFRFNSYFTFITNDKLYPCLICSFELWIEPRVEPWKLLSNLPSESKLLISLSPIKNKFIANKQKKKTNETHNLLLQKKTSQIEEKIRVNSKKYQIHQNPVRKIFLITSSKTVQYIDKLTKTFEIWNNLFNDALSKTVDTSWKLNLIAQDL